MILVFRSIGIDDNSRGLCNPTDFDFLRRKQIATLTHVCMYPRTMQFTLLELLKDMVITAVNHTAVMVF